MISRNSLSISSSIGSIGGVLDSRMSLLVLFACLAPRRRSRSFLCFIAFAVVSSLMAFASAFMGQAHALSYTVARFRTDNRARAARQCSNAAEGVEPQHGSRAVPLTA